MPLRSDALVAGAYYHLYNRGVNRQPIFFERENWLYFLQKLGSYYHPRLAEIIAYCLMPNHYHLLVYVKSDEFGSRVMQPLSVSYTKAINQRYQRTGPLFTGPYKAIKIDRDPYLLHLSRYIHLNPVQAELVQRPEEWQYSSYQEFIGIRKTRLCRPDVVIRQFRSPREYADFTMSDQKIDRNLSSLMFDLDDN